MEKAALANPKLRGELDYEYAGFLEQQFAVTTTGAGFDPDRATKTPLFAWHLLADEESVARLATGIAGVRLPAGHRFLELYKGIEESDRTWKMRGRSKVAKIYENRGQYSNAAAMWKTLADAETQKRSKQRYLDQRDQIIKKLIGFDQGKLQPAGDRTTR